MTSMAAALRARPPYPGPMTIGPHVTERVWSPATIAIRGLRASPVMEADRTVVERCSDLIEGALSPQKLEVKGAFDDPNGSHIVIECVSEAFEGKRSLARQQMVFKAIWDEMQGQGGNVHAVDTMILKAPSEVGK